MTTNGKRIVRWALAPLIAILLNGCASSFLTERFARFDCPGGEVLEVRFLATNDGNGSARLWRHVDREKTRMLEPISLRQAPEPRGADSLYTSDTVRLREFGDEILLEVDVKPPVRCQKRL